MSVFICAALPRVDTAEFYYINYNQTNKVVNLERRNCTATCGLKDGHRICIARGLCIVAKRTYRKVSADGR
jgi:hypothetical protein